MEHSFSTENVLSTFFSGERMFHPVWLFLGEVMGFCIWGVYTSMDVWYRSLGAGGIYGTSTHYHTPEIEVPYPQNSILRSYRNSHLF